MRVNKYYDKIYEIENFLSEETRTKLYKIATEFPESSWFSDYSNDFWQKRTMPLPIEELHDLSEKIRSIFKSADVVDEVMELHRFEPGISMDVHQDAIGHSQIKYGAICYINDDFNGGEIAYPSLGFAIKPKAGSLVFHPGDLDHQVLEVKPGPVRYFMTTFIHGDKDKIESDLAEL